MKKYQYRNTVNPHAPSIRNFKIQRRGRQRERQNMEQ